MGRRTTILVLLMAVVIASCGGGEEATVTTEEADSGSTLAPAEPETPTTDVPSADVVEAPELGGTDWVVTNYRLPNGSMTNVWKTEVTISFADDGTVSGSAGCNDYSGSWAVAGDWNEFVSGTPDPADGQELALSDLSWTEMACDDDAIMEQESEILDLLQNAGRWVLIREKFNLRDAEGSFLFEAESA